jgi:hypothetical protein
VPQILRSMQAVLKSAAKALIIRGSIDVVPLNLEQLAAVLDETCAECRCDSDRHVRGLPADYAFLAGKRSVVAMSTPYRWAARRSLLAR